MLTALLHLVSIPVALVYANALEWLIHKHVLHRWGRKRSNFYSFHWHEHHRESRKHGMFDPQYVRPLFTWSPQGKEALSVAGLALAHAPLLPFAPLFTLTAWYAALRYYFVHRRAHLDPAYCKQRSPVHYDHHMGRDQEANWCVTSPWFDLIMGTRKVYTYDEAGRPIAEEHVPVPKGFVARFLAPLRRSAQGTG